MPRSTALQIGLTSLYGFALLVPIAWFGISRSEGSLGYAIGEVIGRSFIPALVVALYYRKKRVTGARILFSMVTWIFIGNVFGLSHGLQYSKPTLRENDIPVILKEAAGISPLPVQDTPERAALRDSFRVVLTRSRKYEQEVARIDGTPEMQVLGQAPSFATLETIQKTLGHLKEERELEAAQGTVLDDFAADISRKVQGFNWSQANRDAFLKGLNGSLAEQQQAPKAAALAKLRWLDANVALYEFAAAHHKEIKSNGKAITIPDAALLKQFNQRADAAEVARKQFLTAFQAWQQAQQAAQQKVGVSRKDLGLGKQ